MKAPSFDGRTEFARYIDEDEREGDNHAAVSAFLMDTDDMSDPKKAHLSVNATELESVSDIAAYYRATLQDGVGPVALCVHKVHKYVDAGKKAGSSVRRSSVHSWVFDGPSEEEPAFKHRFVQAIKEKGRPASPSHCGVEFLRVLSELQQRNFARVLAKRPKFHIL